MKPRKVTPQPWKLEVPRPLDLENEFSSHDDEPTQEIFIDDPEFYMEDLEFDDAITEVEDTHGR